MDQILLFALLGLGPGALTAAIGIGIVVSFRGSGTINLATGAVAMFGAYAFYGLRTDGTLVLPPAPVLPDRIDLGDPLATLPALLLTLLLCALLGVVLELLVLRPLRNATALARLVATLGVLLVIQAIATLRFGPTALSAPRLLGDGTVELFGVPVPSDRFVLAGVVIAVTIALALAYRFSRFGLATRAAAESELKATVAGISANRLSLVNTVIASVLTGALGVLVAPLVELDPNQMVALVVPALAAALLARFTSFAIACAAGLGIGVLQSLLFYAQTKSWFPTADGQPLPGVADVVVLLIIVATMYWRGDALPQRGAVVEQRLPSVPAARHLAMPAVAATVVCAVALVALPPDFRQALVLTLIAVVISLSLIVITGFVGQISLVHLALAGVAGLVVSKLSTDSGLGFPLAAVAAVAVATALGLVVAVSALRVRGVALAVVTLAAAVAVESFIFANPSWGGGDRGSPVPSPTLLGLDLGPGADFPIGDGTLPSPAFGLLALLFAVGTGLLVANLRRSDLGRRMLAVRSNERAAAAAGVHVRNVKLAAFGLSAAIAGLGGVLYGYNFGSVTVGRFGTTMALAFVAYVYVGGITTVLGAVIAGLIATGALVPHAVEDWFGVSPEYTLLLSGLVLVFNVVLNPGGIAAQLEAGSARVMRSRRASGRSGADEPTTVGVA